MSDYELILEYKKGNPLAFDEFYKLTKDSLYTFLQNRSSSDAEDIFQESYIRFIDALHAKTIRNPRGYLFKIALNLLRNTGRRRKTIALSSEYDLPDEEISEADDFPVDEVELQHSLQILAQEKSSFYEVLHLHIFEKMTYDEIAEMLNRNRNTIASQYRYAIHYLKKLLVSVENEGLKKGVLL